MVQSCMYFVPHLQHSQRSNRIFLSSYDRYNNTMEFSFDVVAAVGGATPVMLVLGHGPFLFRPANPFLQSRLHYADQ